MTDTFKHKIKGRYNKKNKQYKDLEKKCIDRLIAQGWDKMPAIRAVHLHFDMYWNKLTHKEQKAIFRGTDKNPSWWNRLFNRVRNRRRDRDTLKKVTLENADELMFTLDRKPNIYYW